MHTLGFTPTHRQCVPMDVHLKQEVPNQKYEYVMNYQGEGKFYEFFSKQRIISLMHSSILRHILARFDSTVLVFFGSFYSFHNFFRMSIVFGLDVTEETTLV
jgi:hypothetical protein